MKREKRLTLKDGLRPRETSQQAEDKRLAQAITIALAILVALLVFSMIVIFVLFAIDELVIIADTAPDTNGTNWTMIQVCLRSIDCVSITYRLAGFLG